MNEKPRSSIGRLSRDRIGRATSRFVRVLGRSATLRKTGTFLRRAIWLHPILGALVLGLVGWMLNRAIEKEVRQLRAKELTTILRSDVTALRIWAQDQARMAQLIAGDEQIAPSVRELIALSQGQADAEAALARSPLQAQLRARLLSRIKSLGCTGYTIVPSSFVVVASDQDLLLGKRLNGYRQEFIGRVLAGKPTVSKPFRSQLLLKDEHGEYRADLPTMFAAAPIKDEKGNTLAALGLRIPPEARFTQILSVASFGDTGETYAFDREGRFLSRSRYDSDLKELGFLADQPDVSSILTLEVRDPGVDVTAGDRPTERRSDQPLTRMAAQAVQGAEGVDVDGYRDYRGVPVIGAWTWLPDFDLGVATEVAVAESFHPLYVLRRAFWATILLLVASAVAIFVLMLAVERKRRQLEKAVEVAEQVGQYRLKQKIGAGGMGTVYLAQHAMLRRPTAVKLLDAARISDAAIARFEREVQLTSALTHPNTVAIFDYGRTPDGLFYYAMEYLEGMDLDELVSRFGPLPESRVVYILRQVCGALAEAHAAGLIHRDLKPANIMLTKRGALYDFAKVLDFGLAKPIDGRETANLTAANVIAGTPWYLSPEGISQPDRVDPRSDVYAIGAIGYFLLTGSPVFDGATVMEICMKHLKEQPTPPSARSGRPVSAGLERLILACLAKSPDDRPANAAILLRELEACETEGAWDADAAAAWWAAQNDGTAVEASPTYTLEPDEPSEPARSNITVIRQIG